VKRVRKILASKEAANERFQIQAAISSTDDTGRIWDVTIVRAGFAPARGVEGKIGFIITKESLNASIQAFNGSRVYLNKEADYYGHRIESKNKSPEDIVGYLKDPYVQGDELHASFHILPSADKLRKDLLYLKSQDQLDIFQLSIDGGYDSSGSQFSPEMNQQVPVISSFSGGDVDIVPRGAAGGGINRLVASQSHNQGVGTMELRLKLMALFALTYPAIFAASNMDWLKVNENEMYSHLLAADRPQGRLHLPEGWDEKTVGSILDSKIAEFKASQGGESVEQKASRELKESQSRIQATQLGDNGILKAALELQNKQIQELRLMACAGQLATTLMESKLPESVTKILAAKWKDKVFVVSDLEADIKASRDMLAPFTAAQINNQGFDIQAGADGEEKFTAALELTFATAGTTLRPIKAGTDEYKKIATVGSGQVSAFTSIREAYVHYTGDANVTGRKKPGRLLASLDTSSWAYVLANVMNKQAVRDYGMMNLDIWRMLVDITSPKDFRANTRVRWGGYANLPAVAEGAAYLGLTSPTDETMNFSVTKRGGTEDVTLEMIKNDDTGSVTKIPTRMARAAAQTLFEFVFDFIRPGVNPTIYDATALYTTGHLNYGTGALDAAYLKAARLRMLKQGQADNSKRLGITPGFLIVPDDLEEVAYELCHLQAAQYTASTTYAASGPVPTFLQSAGIIPIRVDYWTDATDWVLAAKRESGVGIEIGFLDGQETPELFVSDIPNAGSWFTNDVLTYKIRHIYGGGILDYRFFDGSVVAG
jgi:hypothetical protein